MPTKFLDGPAQGVTLSLKRSPVFLRVTPLDGGWLAFDEIDLEPGLTDKLYCYRLRKRIGSYFIGEYDASGYAKETHKEIASYTFYVPQPEPAIMRDGPPWQEWCKAECERIEGVKE